MVVAVATNYRACIPDMHQVLEQDAKDLWRISDRANQPHLRHGPVRAVGHSLHQCLDRQSYAL